VPAKSSFRVPLCTAALKETMLVCVSDKTCQPGRANAGQSPRHTGPQTKKKIKDAGFTRDRCQCDCGLYAPGPAYVTIDWQAGCTAKVRCGMTKLASRLETLRCLPARLPPAKGTPVLATWQPARPVFGCIGVSVAARGPYVCISVGVLVLLTVGGLTSTG